MINNKLSRRDFLKLTVLTSAGLVLSSCEVKTFSMPDFLSRTSFSVTKVNLPTHNLMAYSIVKNSKYLVVFETGLGDDHSVWTQKALPSTISEKEDVLLYDRAGYGKSEKGPSPRDIAKLSNELEAVINVFSDNRKLVLVGHSLGGMIIRDYAIKNSSKVAAMLFVDPSHEAYNNPTQAQEDLIYDAFLKNFGKDFGGAMEAKELINDSQYMTTLATFLPDVPVIVLTSMKVDDLHSESDRQRWFNAHELLKSGVTDFTHISTINSGHYIFLDESNLVLDNLNLLISKLL